VKNNAYKEMFAVEDHHWWYVGLHNLVMLLTEKYYSGQHLSVFDAGCGTGGLLSKFIKAGHEVEGLDYSEEAIHFCQQRGLEKVFHADLNEWAPAANAYDLITLMDVLYHKWVSDEIKVLRLMAYGLKENGLIMINLPAFPILSRQHDDIVMTRRRYKKKMLISILNESGLTPMLISYRLPHAFIIVLLLHYLDALMKHPDDAKSDIADIPSKFVNQAMIQMNRIENRLISWEISIPFGSSLFAVAKKSS